MKHPLRWDNCESFIFFALLVGLSLNVGCQNNQENTMVLLDEKVKEINVSKSNGVGNMNQDIILFL
jgi:hypothetical protein